MQIVLASNNRGKLTELQTMLSPLGVQLLRQGDLGVGEGSFKAYGCDLGHEYVKINADYRT